jgi:hypothetical protein
VDETTKRTELQAAGWQREHRRRERIVVLEAMAAGRAIVAAT